MRHHADTLERTVQDLIAQADGYAREVGELRARVREVRALLVEADSNLGLWVHRYPRNTPEDLVDDVKELRRRIHPHVAARGRGETVNTAGPNPAGSGPGGSTPPAPTLGAAQVSEEDHW